MKKLGYPFGLLDVTGEMKAKWKDRIPGLIEQKTERHSAVLLLLVEKNGQLEVLFEVRAANLHRQPGEVCFPGGAVEKDECFEDAAVRETMEELMVERGQIEVLAPLDYLKTSSGLTVHAYLGVLNPYNGTYSTDEVDHVFSVPLHWFMENDPEKYVAKVHTIPDEDFPFELVPGGKNYNWSKSHYDIYFYRYGEEIIWGMTAKLMYAFVKLCRGERL